MRGLCRQTLTLEAYLLQTRYRQVLTLRKGQICTMLGYWELKSHIRIRTIDGEEGLVPATYVSPYHPTTLIEDAGLENSLSIGSTNAGMHQHQGLRAQTHALTHADTHSIVSESFTAPLTHPSNYHMTSHPELARSLPSPTPDSTSRSSSISPQGGGLTETGAIASGHPLRGEQRWRDGAEGSTSGSRCSNEAADGVQEADSTDSWTLGGGHARQSQMVTARERIEEREKEGEGVAPGGRARLSAEAGMDHTVHRDHVGFPQRSQIQTLVATASADLCDTSSPPQSSLLASRSLVGSWRPVVRGKECADSEDERALAAIRQRRVKLQEELQALAGQVGRVDVCMYTYAYMRTHQ